MDLPPRHRRHACVARIARSASSYSGKPYPHNGAALHDRSITPPPNLFHHAPPTLDDAQVVCLPPAFAFLFTPTTPAIFPRIFPGNLLTATFTLKKQHDFDTRSDPKRSIFHILEMALGFSSTQDFAAASCGKTLIC